MTYINCKICFFIREFCKSCADSYSRSSLLFILGKGRSVESPREPADFGGCVGDEGPECESWPSRDLIDGHRGGEFSAENGFPADTSPVPARS